MADTNWQASLRPSGSSFGGWVADPPQGAWDTIIEILDPTGRVLLSGRVDQYLSGFADDQYAYAYREDQAGQPLIEVFRLPTVRP